MISEFPVAKYCFTINNKDNITMTMGIVLVSSLLNLNRCLPFTDEVAGRCSVKKVFWKIPQNSQENTRVGVSFLIKLQASGL